MISTVIFDEKHYLVAISQGPLGDICYGFIFFVVAILFFQ